MELIKLQILISIGVGCLFGFLRYVLDDKWNKLPKGLCRFCITSWWCIIFSVFSNGIYSIRFHLTTQEILFSIILSAVTAITAASFSYVYIKNAN